METTQSPRGSCGTSFANVAARCKVCLWAVPKCNRSGPPVGAASRRVIRCHLSAYIDAKRPDAACERRGLDGCARMYRQTLSVPDEKTYAPFSIPQKGGTSDPQRSIGVVPGKGREGRRPAVHGLPRSVAALHHPRRQARRGRVRGRPGLRRLQHPRLAGDQRERHARRAAARDGRARSVLQDPDPVDDLQHPGPDHPRGLQPRSAQRRPQGGQLPEEHGHRRHVLHRAGGRVLHLRRRPLRPDGQQRLLLPRQHRGPVEPRPRGEARTWATSCATRKATSPSRRPTR